MKLILVDPNDNMCIAWRAYFDGLPDVEIVKGYFEKLPDFDCMVSAANSFGIMDGGVDLAISEYFGWDLMKRVQRVIIDDYLGEQPVGTSIIVETNHEKHPYLAHTPTMRIPMSIENTDNVYLAMWAMLREVRLFNRNAEHKIETVACPGLGTGYGRMPFNEAARQMATAYKHYLNPPERITSGFAHLRQAAIRFGGKDGLNQPMD